MSKVKKSKGLIRTATVRERTGSRKGGKVVGRVPLALCLLAFFGCGIAGSWKRVAVDPPGAPFPMDHVTFDRDNNYTATWSQQERARTSTGRYKWNGFKLDIMERGSLPRAYRARLRLDGKLVLTYEERGAKVAATLERVHK